MSQSTIFACAAGYFGRSRDAGAVGVFRRDLGNGGWQNVLDAVEAFAVLIHPADPGLVVAGTTDGVWRSTDGGRTFARTAFPDAGRQVWSLTVAEQDPDVMYAGASPVSVYRSEDRGATWSRLPDPGIAPRCTGPFDPRVMRLVQRPGRPEEIFAAMEIGGAMRTTDGGETWTDLGDPLVTLAEQPHLQSAIVQQESKAEGMLDCHAVAIPPGDPDAAILALRMGLFRSRDGGRSWQDMDLKRFSPTTYARDIKASPHDADTLFAALSIASASHDGGVYRSTDAGETWQRFDKVQVHGTIMSIGLHGSDPGIVAIGARYDGEIFVTRDGGESWEDASLPGPVKDLYAVACG